MSVIRIGNYFNGKIGNTAGSRNPAIPAAFLDCCVFRQQMVLCNVNRVQVGGSICLFNTGVGYHWVQCLCL